MHNLNIPNYFKFPHKHAHFQSMFIGPHLSLRQRTSRPSMYLCCCHIICFPYEYFSSLAPPTPNPKPPKILSFPESQTKSRPPWSLALTAFLLSCFTRLIGIWNVKLCIMMRPYTVCLGSTKYLPLFHFLPLENWRKLTPKYLYRIAHRDIYVTVPVRNPRGAIFEG